LAAWCWYFQWGLTLLQVNHCECRPCICMWLWTRSYMCGTSTVVGVAGDGVNVCNAFPPATSYNCYLQKSIKSSAELLKVNRQ
jgi:hypothetical protein